MRASSIDHGQCWNLDRGGVLNLYGNLTEDDCRRIAGHEKVTQVQFGTHLHVSTATWQALDAHVFTNHPDAVLRYGWHARGYGRVELGSLEHLPALHALTVTVQADLTPVRTHGGLTRLGVGDGGTSLHPIAGLASIRSLWLSKDARDQAEVLGTLPQLDDLTLSGIAAQDLSYLQPAHRLQSLALWFGGSRSLVDLPSIPALRRVDIWRTRNLQIDDLAALNDIAALDTLALRELPRITALTWLTNPTLTNLELDLKKLDRLTDLTGLPGLTRLALRDPVPHDCIDQLTQVSTLRELYLHREDVARRHDPHATHDPGFTLAPITFAAGDFMKA